MAKKIIEFLTEDGEVILVEADIRPIATMRGGEDGDATSDQAVRSSGYFSKAIGTIKSVSKEVISVIRQSPVIPDEVEIKIGMKATSGTGALWDFVLVKAQGEGHIEVVLKWKNNQFTTNNP